MNSRLLDPLRTFSDVMFHPGASAAAIDRLERSCGIVLPTDHRATLLDSNGVEAYGRFLRLFGVDTIQSIDLEKWNHPDAWKYAWDERCTDYWCFAGNAWGDQYAYRIDEIDGESAPVYLLDGFEMDADPIASSFSDFMKTEFIPSATDPYQTMTKEARQKFGDLELGEHVIYFPSIFLLEDRDIRHVQKMPARVAMILNGEYAIQIRAIPPEGRVMSVVPYEDEVGRQRLRLVWE